MPTGGPPYTNPLRPKIIIKTVDGADELYTYNAFDTSHTISIAQANMENAIAETGTFNLLVNDHNNEIGKDNIHDVKVYLSLGKTDTTFQQFLVGFGEIFEIDRPGTAAQQYTISGFGTKRWAYQLFISRRERYRKGESGAKIYNIIDNALTKRLWRPLKKLDESIEDITGWNPSGISTSVNTPLTVIDKSFVYFGDLCDELTNIGGSSWFIDYSVPDEEIFTLTYKPDLMTNIIIKSGDLQDRINDNGNKISYIKSAFRVTDDGSSEAGFTNRLFTMTVQDEQEMFTLNSAKSLTNLTFKAIGQQAIIDNDARRIKSIELKLKKIGDPSSPQDRVTGGIFMDTGSNKPNMTYTLDEFHIDLGSIGDGNDEIRVDVDVSPKKLDNAQSKIWVVLFQRSNEEIPADPNDPDAEPEPDGNGNPNHGTKHTIGWYHNNMHSTVQPYYSGQAVEGDFNKKSKLSWQTSNQGPLYWLRIFSDIRRIFSRTNGASKNRSRLKESLIDSSFLFDPQDVMRYISLNLAITSKQRRGLGDFRVTIPNEFIYRPYQIVSFHDGLSKIDEPLQVQRATYNCNAAGGDDAPIGTLHANLTLSGSYNTLVGACSCL